MNTVLDRADTGDRQAGRRPLEPAARATPSASVLPLDVVDRSAGPGNNGKARGKSRRHLWLLPALLLAVAAGIGVAQRNAATVPAPVPVQAPGVIVGIGTLLPQDDVITLAPPYGAGDARIASLKVREGDTVAAGDVLAILDNERSLDAAIQTARATLAMREAVLRQTRESVLASRQEATASLSRAQAAIANARSDLDRVRELSAGGFAADAALDQRRATHEQALQDAERAKATLSRYAFASMDDQADVRVAARNVDSARADLARAQADLEKAYVRAPTNGTILTVHVRPGERPGTGGILNFGNLESMKAEIEVYQTSMGALAPGARVTITGDALPKPLQGTVTRVGLEVGRQTVTDASPAANTDARVVKVQATLDAASSAIARRFTHLQVTARIDAETLP